MTTIYRGTVQECTIDLLHFWLQRDFLPSVFDVQSPLPWPADSPLYGYAQPNDGKLYVLDDAWQAILEERRDTYELTWELRRVQIEERRYGDGGLWAGLFARQWRVSTVAVAIVGYEPGTVADKLRSWLADRYGCKVTHRQLTQKQQEQWNELQEFTGKVNSTGKTIKEVSQEDGVTEEAMRQTWRRLRAKIGVDPPWPH